ncbi:MAG: rhodanese-like domain-containing protein [Gammaproteobacteria bacterium]|nr:rhodanese-like domain-containing protein [Gammaproteobacteria bacterium]MYD77301.1 rhodanese-like domain-containing protein [Gammaproteobacteria bacterium]MYJ51871.1 rhodanese-like domain-containing protein [Gammaproteobacteria bacterium]
MITANVSFKEMVERADAAVVTLSPEEVAERLGRPGVLLVDIRDIRELEREGRIPGSRHIPRGMLEFWIHPESPYYRDYFDECEELIVHCNRGWRSALAACALKDLGIAAAHMSGGYAEWQEKGLPTESHERK